MKNLNKKLHLLEIRQVISDFPILLFFQHNNLQMENWVELRTQLQKFPGTCLVTVKNKLLVKILQLQKEKGGEFHLKTTSLKAIPPLLQAPCFMIGCLEVDPNFWKLLQKTSNILFVGGIYKNSRIHHVDIEKLVKLDNSIYLHLLGVLEVSSHLHATLQTPLQLEFLEYPTKNFVNVLTQIDTPSIL